MKLVSAVYFIFQAIHSIPGSFATPAPQRISLSRHDLCFSQRRETTAGVSIESERPSVAVVDLSKFLPGVFNQQFVDVLFTFEHITSTWISVR